MELKTNGRIVERDKFNPIVERDRFPSSNFETEGDGKPLSRPWDRKVSSTSGHTRSEREILR